MTSDTTHLRPDGTTFPPVTPDPPAPPGYVEPTIPDCLVSIETAAPSAEGCLDEKADLHS